ncbi:MAG: G5 domain-containing protein [Thermoleophilia bacterium]
MYTQRLLNVNIVHLYFNYWSYMRKRYSHSPYYYVVLFLMIVASIIFWGCGNYSGKKISGNQESSWLKVAKLENKAETLQDEIDFDVQNQYDQSLAAGATQILQEGKKGLKSVTLQILLVNGKEFRRRVISETVITPPVPQIICVGSAPGQTSSSGSSGGASAQSTPQAPPAPILCPPVYCHDGTRDTVCAGNCVGHGGTCSGPWNVGQGCDY